MQTLQPVDRRPFSVQLREAARVRLPGVDAGWTFGSFIRACYDAGIHDGDELDSIEFGISDGTRRVIRVIGDGGRVEIWETRRGEVK